MVSGTDCPSSKLARDTIWTCFVKQQRPLRAAFTDKTSRLEQFSFKLSDTCQDVHDPNDRHVHSVVHVKRDSLLCAASQSLQNASDGSSRPIRHGISCKRLILDQGPAEAFTHVLLDCR